jgi:ubiquinone/menaquinone biosynthesis C-methylase UbiE
VSFDPRTHYQDMRVAAGYDRERFGSLAGRVFQAAERLALRRALRGLTKGAAVLDAPCGTGRVAAALLDWGFCVTGLDLSDEMLAVSRRRLSGWNGSAWLCRGNLAALPFGERTFDLALCIRCLPHFAPADRRQMLRELARISRRWVLISLSYSNRWYRLRRMLKRWLRHAVPTRYPATRQAIRDELKAAGLRAVRRCWTIPLLSEELLLLCEREAC